MAYKEEAPRLVGVSQRLDAIISTAIWEFAEKNPPWEAHVRYHDEPLWVLRREDGDRVRRIQVAFFAQIEGPGLYIIPDRSDLNGEDRVKFRLKCQTVVPYKELVGYDSDAVKETLSSTASCFDKYLT